MPAKKLALARIERNYRGQKFVLEEVDAATYDDCVQKGTDTYQNPLTGEDEERVDEQRVIRMLLMKSLISPKIERIQELGARLVRNLERDVRTLHFGEEPQDPPKKADEDDGDDESPNEVDA